ncbi:Gag-Pol polyprotein [Gossypium australe]|uniref:Gag-Pol polyprotein n=1 Tax=Gossypium australe TaxID=47621 RepID=A0A5B6WPH5_9ROSI|nr:Gag-Pol polyprotein [Gossypium australe]
MDPDPGRAAADDAASNMLAPAEGTAPVGSKPETSVDDPERAKFWLENTIRVFDELSYTPEECMKCVVSLLRDSANQWWNTLVSVEFRKKYISQRFIDQKRKEFLELKQGRITVTEYEREFVRLSKYALECVST